MFSIGRALIQKQGALGNNRQWKTERRGDFKITTKQAKHSGVIASCTQHYPFVRQTDREKERDRN